MVSGVGGCGWGGWIDDKYWRRLGYPWQGMGRAKDHGGQGIRASLMTSH